MRPRLIRESGEFPPNSYPFLDRITGKKYDDSHSNLAARTEQVVNDRKANSRLFKDARFISPDYVKTEISEYVCEQLPPAIRAKYCTAIGEPIQVTTPAGEMVTYVAGKICRRCGSSNVEELLCATCSGRRVTGYKCNDCALEMPR